MLAAIGGGWAVAHRGGSSGKADAVLSCLQLRNLSANIVTSSTGERQVEVTHGAARVSASLTLESSATDIAFLDSEEQASWWQDNLGQAPGATPDSVARVGRTLVFWGQASTAAERAAINACVGA